jgi:hypothetical protein
MFLRIFRVLTFEVPLASLALTWYSSKMFKYLGFVAA